MNIMHNATGRSRALALAVLMAATAACATVPEAGDISQARNQPEPIEISASRLNTVTYHPGREIPRTLSPMTVFTTRDLEGTGYTDIVGAIRSLSPFTGGL